MRPLLVDIWTGLVLLTPTVEPVEGTGVGGDPPVQDLVQLAQVGRLIPLAISSFVYSIQLECLLRTELYITLLRGPEARHSSTLYIFHYTIKNVFMCCVRQISPSLPK